MRRENEQKKKEERKRREFSNLSEAFADIFSGAQTGHVIFKGRFHGSKAKVVSGSQQQQGESQGKDGEGEKAEEEEEEEDMDLVLARALQAIEDDAYKAVQRMEEEDERLAREIERREREAAGVGGDGTRDDGDSLRLARELAAEEKPPAAGAKRRRLISTSQGGSQGREEEGAMKDEGWRELVRQDSLTERDRRLALALFKEEKEREEAKRKREEEDELLAKSLQAGGQAKRPRIGEAGEPAEMTTDEAIVRLLQEEEEEAEQRYEREKKAREEEEMSRKLIEKLMREEDKDHDEWVRSELAMIDAREREEEKGFGYGGGKKKAKPKHKWPGFGFGFGDKERMRAKRDGEIVGDSDWKSSRFFPDTSVLEGFLRSCAHTSGTVTILNVMRYGLVEQFERKWAQFKAKYGSTDSRSQTTLAFHGTRSELIPSITSKGLLVPGTAPGVEHVTDSGYYGRGIYLSPNPEVAQGYAADGQMLVCAVLMGRVYACTEVNEGADCEPGYDSHTSPCGEELVLFEAAQVLPCYLVKWDS